MKRTKITVKLSIGIIIASFIESLCAAPLAYLTLVKEVKGGAATPTDWVLTADGKDGNDLSGNGKVAGSVNPDTFLLSESTGPNGYTAGSWKCNGGTLVSNSLTLVADDDVTCTIVSTYDRTLVVFDSDFALPDMLIGNGTGTPVCVDEFSGLFVAGCDGAVGPKGDKGDTGDIGPQGPVGPAGTLAPDSVTNVELADGAVVGGKFGDILDGSITFHDLGDGSVGALALATDSVRDQELVEDVTFGKTGNGGSLKLKDNTNAETIVLDGDAGTIVADGSIHTKGRLNIGSAEYLEDGGPNLISTGVSKIKTAGFDYTNPKTGYLSVGAPAFRGNQNLPDYIDSVNSMATVRGSTAPYSARAYAPVFLPDGATITKIDCFILDQSTGVGADITIDLYKKSFTEYAAVSVTQLTMVTSAAYNLSNPISLSHTLATPEIVNTYNNQYSLSLHMQQAQRSTQVGFQGCRIAYTISTLDP